MIKWYVSDLQTENDCMIKIVMNMRYPYDTTVEQEYTVHDTAVYIDEYAGRVVVNAKVPAGSVRSRLTEVIDSDVLPLLRRMCYEYQRNNELPDIKITMFQGLLVNLCYILKTKSTKYWCEYGTTSDAQWLQQFTRLSSYEVTGTNPRIRAELKSANDTVVNYIKNSTAMVNVVCLKCDALDIDTAMETIMLHPDAATLASAFECAIRNERGI